MLIIVTVFAQLLAELQQPTLPMVSVYACVERGTVEFKLYPGNASTGCRYVHYLLILF